MATREERRIAIIYLSELADNYRNLIREGNHVISGALLNSVRLENNTLTAIFYAIYVNNQFGILDEAINTTGIAISNTVIREIIRESVKI